MSTPRNSDTVGGSGPGAGKASEPQKRRGRPAKKVLAADGLGLGRENPTAELPATALTILTAARRVLAERGLEGLTIEAVAHEAQVGRHVIPYHFGSRAGLVTILFDSLFHDLAVGYYNRRASGPRGSLGDYLDWIRQEAEDPAAQRDFFELIVVALREPELRRRIAELYDEYRDLTLELSGLPHGDALAGGGSGAPAGGGGEAAVDPERQRRIEAVGSVLMAIGDGLGLHAVLDPGFDLEGAIAAVDVLIGGAIAELGGDERSGGRGGRGRLSAGALPGCGQRGGRRPVRGRLLRDRGDAVHGHAPQCSDDTRVAGE